MPRMIIRLTQAEQEALDKLAEISRRDPRAQASFLIRECLENVGLLDGCDFDPFFPLAAPLKIELLRLLREEPDGAPDVLAEQLAARVGALGLPLMRAPVLVDLLREVQSIMAAPANA